ncbi:protein E16 [Elephant endotheliotropic herpesvirus 1A]|uniref:Membrane protein EE33 n=2 Tax=Elephantid herpesvirus 1 TaxID=146015 RepID=M4JX84_ELHV1|nr:membrane protein EE33 [Elephantid betaherpesvirus 1]AGG16035.1 protein E16 [Elephant endotheliotropic herpesvirus 1A]AGE09892.1 membrane protein EE33 [Elephantid betaherpesvirus 1]AGE10001.1 membrane protein EE33 [Elephantid betaherpesvirus 1]QEY96094.1 membrane protein EE33 [Elephant endotheliotropic herpesvirus 1A]QOE74538.1 protein E16 [Elephant endotheliotropic herpesvirus 1A]
MTCPRESGYRIPFEASEDYIIIIPFYVNILLFVACCVIYHFKGRSGYVALVNPVFCILASCSGAIRLLNVLQTPDQRCTTYELAGALFTVLHILSITVQCVLIVVYVFRSINHWVVQYMAYNLNRLLILLTAAIFCTDFGKLGVWILRYMNGGVNILIMYVALYLLVFLYICIMFDIYGSDELLTFEYHQLLILGGYFITFLFYHPIASLTALDGSFIWLLSNTVYLLTRRMLWTFLLMLENV